MRLQVRWYPVAEQVKHLVSFTPSQAPIWGTFDEAYDWSSEAAVQDALRACRNFHGKEEDIVIVRIRRVKAFRKRAPMPCGWCVTGVECPRHPGD